MVEKLANISLEQTLFTLYQIHRNLLGAIILFRREAPDKDLDRRNICVCTCRLDFFAGEDHVVAVRDLKTTSQQLVARSAFERSRHRQRTSREMTIDRMEIDEIHRHCDLIGSGKGGICGIWVRFG